LIENNGVSGTTVSAEQRCQRNNGVRNNGVRNNGVRDNGVRDNYALVNSAAQIRLLLIYAKGRKHD